VKIYDNEVSLRKTLTLFCIAAVVIIGAGIWLATIGDEIAHATGWGQSFVGSLFLAFTTTLPEITVSFTLIRIGANDMAIANIIGSNLFNLSIIPIIDIIYAKGPIFAEISESHLATAAAVFSMTLLLITALTLKPGRHFRLNWFNVSLIILFVAGTYISFTIT
jgi:cation:H+ antiporter